MYLEHNELRELPGGQWWSRLHVLSLDWEPLLRTGHTLLASVRLRRGGYSRVLLEWGQRTGGTEQALAVDSAWTVVARCHYLLQAPHLRKLALGSHLIHMHAGDALPPLASAEAVLQALNEHPALREVLLVARPGVMSAGVSARLLERNSSAFSLPEVSTAAAVCANLSFPTCPCFAASCSPRLWCWRCCCAWLRCGPP